MYIPISWCPQDEIHEWLLSLFFFPIPPQLLSRCGALFWIFWWVINLWTLSLPPCPLYIQLLYNPWFWQTWILPVLNIPQLSVSMTRFTWLLPAHIPHSPIPSAFCFHRRSVKSSYSISISFLEHLQWVIPSVLSPQPWPPFSDPLLGLPSTLHHLL